MRVPQRPILRRRGGSRLGRQLFQGGVSAPGKDHRALAEDVILLIISSILVILAVLCKLAPRTRIVGPRHRAFSLYDKSHALVDKGGGALAAGHAVKRASFEPEQGALVDLISSAVIAVYLPSDSCHNLRDIS